MTSKIFLNYRRSDADAWADRLFERLKALPSVGDVFMDIDGSIPLGRSWAEWIDSRVSTCDVMLVLVGRSWAAEFKARSDPEALDYVRVEIESALARRIPVVPVLLGDTPIPSHESLPPSIRPLLDLQATRLQRATFAVDATTLVDGLVRAIELVRGETARAPQPAGHGPTMNPLQAIAAAAAADDGVSGVFELMVKKTSSEKDLVWLMSESDYRDPRCLSIAVDASARRELTAIHGEDPAVFLRGRTAIVSGTVRKQRIDFISGGKPTGNYY